FYSAVKEGRVEAVEITGMKVKGVYATTGSGVGRPKSFTTSLPLIEDDALMPLLREKGVKVEVVSDETSLFTYALLNILPILFIIGVFVWMSRRSSKMMGGPFGGMMKGRVKRF